LYDVFQPHTQRNVNGPLTAFYGRFTKTSIWSRPTSA
jgi:hypothetical protein